MIRSLLLALLVGLSFSNEMAETPDTVFLEELTWTEVREAIDYVPRLVAGTRGNRRSNRAPRRVS